MCYVNAVCDSCESFGMCVVVYGEFDEQSVLCADCARIREELATEFGQDEGFDCDDSDAYDENVDWSEYADEGDTMFGRDDDNPVSMGAYDD